MILDVSQTNRDNNVLFPIIPLVDVLRMSGDSLLNLKKMVDAVPDKGWLNEATSQAVLEMKSQRSDLVEEAKSEVKKARKLLKEKYPIRYMVKRYIINPLKAIKGLCQRKSK